LKEADQDTDGLAGKISARVTARLKTQNEIVAGRQMNAEQLVRATAHAQPGHLTTYSTRSEHGENLSKITTTLCLKKNPRDYVFDDNLNSKRPIVIIFGTVIT